MPIKLLICDYDGTLFDTRPVAYATMSALFAHYGLAAPSPDVFFSTVTSDFPRFYHAHGIPTTASRETINEFYGRHFVQPAQFDLIAIRDGVPALLALCAARGIPVAIVSGNLHSVITYSLDMFKISHLVHHIIGDACGKVRELQNVLDHFGVCASTAAYIDDTCEGVRAARTVGLTAVGITGGFNTEEEIRAGDPHHIISDFTEFSDILLSLI